MQRSDLVSVAESGSPAATYSRHVDARVHHPRKQPKVSYLCAQSGAGRHIVSGREGRRHEAPRTARAGSGVANQQRARTPWSERPARSQDDDGAEGQPGEGHLWTSRRSWGSLVGSRSVGISYTVVFDTYIHTYIHTCAGLCVRLSDV